MYPSPIRIAIDARYLSHGLVGGVNTYVRNLVRELVNLEGEETYEIWIDDKAPFDLQGMTPPDQVRVLHWNSSFSSLRLDRKLGFYMRRAGASVCHFPANYGFAPPGVPAVITLHDAINVLPLREILAGHAKNARTIATMSYLHWVTTRSIRRQPVVVTVSEYSRREILRHVDLEPERVRVVYSAAEPVFRQLSEGEVEQFRRDRRLRRRVLLADGIKNAETALEAYRRLPAQQRRETSLVFFSRRRPSTTIEAAARCGECVVLLRPSQQDLVLLYNLADLFLFPSWYEGFGLPAIEAMACGTPVIGSNRGAIPEILGDAGITVDANDASALARHVTDLLDDEPRLWTLSDRALCRAGGFTWRRTAEQTREVYRDALQLHRQPGRQHQMLRPVSETID